MTDMKKFTTEPHFAARWGVMVVILDRRFRPMSRRQLVERCQQWRAAGHVALVTGVNGPVVAQTTRGLKHAVYNAGCRECIAAPTMAQWLPWAEVWLLEDGVDWRLMPAETARHATPVPARAA